MKFMTLPTRRRSSLSSPHSSRLAVLLGVAALTHSAFGAAAGQAYDVSSDPTVDAEERRLADDTLFDNSSNKNRLQGDIMTKMLAMEARKGAET
ncbi:MAG: hypothetical protein SGARI_003760 [Bacillariaceae sp.]